MCLGVAIPSYAYCSVVQECQNVEGKYAKCKHYATFTIVLLLEIVLWLHFESCHVDLGSKLGTVSDSGFKFD